MEILNDLSWTRGSKPEMYVDGNHIPMSFLMIQKLIQPINHPLPLYLYIGDDVRVYKEQLTGLDILNKIRDYWYENVGQDDANKKERWELPTDKLNFGGITKYKKGYRIDYY